MRTPPITRPPISALSVLVASLTAFAGCATIEYGRVQDSFQACVEKDNISTSSGGTVPVDCYRKVISDLRGLGTKRLSDGALESNAYLILSFSQWRTGDHTGAVANAEKGLRQDGLVAGSRDDILLRLLPALVIDQENMEAWQGAGGSLSAEAYAPLERDFLTEAEILSNAEAALDPSTPQSVRDYFFFQKNRLLGNWRRVINSLDVTLEASAAAMARAETALGGRRLKEVMDEARSRIRSTSGFQQVFR